MNVSYLIVTYNRREGLLANLRALYAGDPRADVWVVDNASTDGTIDAMRIEFARVRIIQLDRNIGMPARNVALRQMRAEFVVLLDDDSYPLPGAVEMSTSYMRQHPDVAAVVGQAILPDGLFEAPALPSVILGCATCIRLRAIRDVGFFPHDFFRQAEEYDLSLRLWDAGWRIERFEDIQYRHNKQPSASRSSREVMKLDLKHNLIVAMRYLPTPFSELYAEDIATRYAAMMQDAGYGDDVDGVMDEVERYVADSNRIRRRRLTDAAFETLFGHRSQFTAIRDWANATGARRVVIADLSKNLFATFEACRRAGLTVEAIVDHRSAFVGTSYRRVPVINLAQVKSLGVDGVVVSNTNPSQIDAIERNVGRQFKGPILRLWNGRTIAKHVRTVPALRSAA